MTNRYLEYHEEKLNANDDILRAEAAKTYWKTRDFDPIAISYVDDEKEKQFLAEREAKAKEHGKDQVKKLPLTVQNEGLMYNPINMVVEDETRLKDKDQREKNKKQRYGARYIAEKMTKEEEMAEKQRLEQMSLQKVSHQRVAEEINRGFDILTNGELRGGLAKIEVTGYMKQ